jgi:hypothetical protein
LTHDADSWPWAAFQENSHRLLQLCACQDIVMPDPAAYCTMQRPIALSSLAAPAVFLTKGGFGAKPPRVIRQLAVSRPPTAATTLDALATPELT